MDKGPSKKIKRGDENTTLTISLAKELRARIEHAAEEDRRKVSPWIAIQLEKILDEMDELDAEDRPALLKVADDPAPYKARRVAKK